MVIPMRLYVYCDTMKVLCVQFKLITFSSALTLQSVQHSKSIDIKKHSHSNVAKYVNANSLL